MGGLNSDTPLYIYPSSSKNLIYSGAPLIETPFLPNNSVRISEVSSGEREHHMHS